MSNGKKQYIKTNSIYWLNSDKIYNYLGKTISKTRPFICVHKEKISNIEYYYFVSGTSKHESERRVRNFSKFFYTIKQDNHIRNYLEKDTHFQLNLIYVISKECMNLFFEKYAGKITKSESNEIFKLIFNSIDKEIYYISYWSNNFSKWICLNYGKSFIKIASQHHNYKRSSYLRDNIKGILNNDSLIVKKISNNKFLSKEISKNFISMIQKFKK